jgi:hypothetical protein
MWKGIEHTVSAGKKNELLKPATSSKSSASTFLTRNTASKQSAAKGENNRTLHGAESTDDSEHEGKGDRCETESDSNTIYSYHRNESKPAKEIALSEKHSGGVVEWTDYDDSTENKDEEPKRATGSYQRAKSKHWPSISKQESNLSFHHSKSIRSSGIFKQDRKSRASASSKKRPRSLTTDSQDEVKTVSAKATGFVNLKSKRCQNLSNINSDINKQARFYIIESEDEMKPSIISNANTITSRSNSRSLAPAATTKTVLVFGNSDDEAERKHLKMFAAWRAQQQKPKAPTNSESARASPFKKGCIASGKTFPVTDASNVNSASNMVPTKQSSSTKSDRDEVAAPAHTDPSIWRPSNP